MELGKLEGIRPDRDPAKKEPPRPRKPGTSTGARAEKKKPTPTPDAPPRPANRRIDVTA